MAMEERINILSKTSSSALTASSASYRRPKTSSEENHINEPYSSCVTLPSSNYRRRRRPRSASTPPTPHQCTSRNPAPNSSSSSKSPQSDTSSADADYIQTVFPPKLKNNKLDMDLAMFTQIAEITDCLYLSAAAAVRHDRVRQRMITHIINCTLDIPNFKAPNVECINIQVDDSSRAHLGIYFDRCADLIRQVSQKGGRVLVHCVAGISRSASLCIAYLMKYERMTLEQAYRHVKRRRPVIHPNVGFWRQLIDYEKRIFGTTSVKMVHSNMGMIPEVYAEESKHIAVLPRNLRFR